MKNRFYGFTLAEVLITLAIIGVVAALTIPTVVRNYQKQQMLAQLKKTYSALANTTNMAIADEGPVTGWKVDGGSDGAVNFTNRYLIPYLKVAKNCEAETSGECVFYYMYLNGSCTGCSFGSDYARFFLTDGTLIGIYTYNGEGSNGYYYQYANIIVDVNGTKKPNSWGKDIFRFDYYIFEGSSTSANNGKFMPWSWNRTRDFLVSEEHSGTCNKNERGQFCAALIMKDGWKISDDYPW
jgi:prepilin-type N-terminal cleavage/methylation domain-containing protein